MTSIVRNAFFFFWGGGGGGNFDVSNVSVLLEVICICL